jgi:hypothetical protein
MVQTPRSPAPTRDSPRSSSCALASLIAAALLGGCTANGDFGRIRPELVTDDMHAWMGRDAVGSLGEKPSKFPLTDDERQLRDRAFALIQPAYDRNRWFSVLEEYGFDRWRDHEPPFDPSAYWRHLAAAGRRSEASSYAQIDTDAGNDVERLDPFFATAARVTDMDARRAQSLAFVAGSTGLSKAEAVNARRRNDENALVVAWVCRSLAERVTSYRFALERLAIGLPSPDAAGTDRSINLLAVRTGQYCKAPQGVVAKG